MQNYRGTSVNKNRDAWVEINLGNLENNVLEIKNYLKNKGFNPDIFAVIKADGYGHGSLMCAPTLIACGVKYFGVASIDEGIELRENKIAEPILVLGASPLWAFENAIKNDIEISIFNEEHLDVANQLYKRLNKKLKAHIKIDTGMNRIGISIENAKDYIKKVLNSNFIELKGVFTHFADVENPDLFKKQINNFQNSIEDFKDIFKQKNVKLHCLNSPAIFSYPEYSFDMVRMGITMWGLTPFSNNNENMKKMLPVMGLKARITNIHTLKKGEGISYGHTYIAKKDTKVATIPLGYADGVSRKLSGQISANVNGSAIYQIGRITMDQMMFDITGLNCSVGDVITLIGEENKIDNIDTWAEKLGTINYELTCRLKMRLPRIYVR
ncbi:MAG: alanine racemase [Candidatus Gastranaerophilales bacterium]|nr:alanine racemase [Candidatus Gastranaerophilales bacterium]